MNKLKLEEEMENADVGEPKNLGRPPSPRPSLPEN